MIVQPRTPSPTVSPPRPGGLIPCGLDRHFGPFEALDPLRGWLGTDWYTCRGCRSVVTHANASPRAAA
jgi:hypothetical protein